MDRAVLEPMVRIELTTCCLRNSCSTTELHRRRRGIVAEKTPLLTLGSSSDRMPEYWPVVPH